MPASLEVQLQQNIDNFYIYYFEILNEYDQSDTRSYGARYKFFYHISCL